MHRSASVHDPIQAKRDANDENVKPDDDLDRDQSQYEEEGGEEEVGGEPDVELDTEELEEIDEPIEPLRPHPPSSRPPTRTTAKSQAKGIQIATWKKF